MSKWKPIATCVALGMALAGCAGNAVSLLEYRGAVTLIDSAGTLYPGKTQFHLGKQDGTLSIPSTSYGDLAGNIVVKSNAIRRSGSGVTMIAGGPTLIAPSFSTETISLPGNNSTIYLHTNNRLVIECVAEVDMRTPGYPVAYMIGNGACLDAQGRKLRIIFSEEKSQ